VAWLAKLMHLCAQGEGDEKDDCLHATCFRTRRRVMVPKFG
jgi:hypothetical protein